MYRTPWSEVQVQVFFRHWRVTLLCAGILMFFITAEGCRGCVQLDEVRARNSELRSANSDLNATLKLALTKQDTAPVTTASAPSTPSQPVDVFRDMPGCGSFAEACVCVSQRGNNVGCIALKSGIGVRIDSASGEMTVTPVSGSDAPSRIPSPASDSGAAPTPITPPSPALPVVPPGNTSCPIPSADPRSPCYTPPRRFVPPPGFVPGGTPI